MRTLELGICRKSESRSVPTLLAAAALSCFLMVSCGGGGGSSSTPPLQSVEISISPTTASLMVDGTQQFTVTVSNTTNTAVTWSVNNTAGGNTTLGTISPTGLYAAPDLVPSSTSVTVTATSQADTTKSASATISLAYPAPSLSSVSPTYVLVNSPETTLTVAGTGFTRASTVSFNNSSLSTTFVSATQMTAVLPAAAEGTEGQFNLAVVNPSPGGGTSSVTQFSVVGAALTVNIIDLPAGTLANVTVTGPNGLNFVLASSQTITGAEGTYNVTARGVAVGSSTYNAKAPAQGVTIAVGNTATLTVDYYDVVPNTTKVLDQTAMQSLAVSTDGLTLTMSASSPVAASLATGDVIVVPPTAAAGVAPQGMLRQVVSVSSNGSQVVATTQKGTLAGAFQRADFQVQTQLTSNTIQAVRARRGVTFHPGEYFHRARNGRKSLSPADSLSDPCGGYSLGVFDVTQPIQVDAVPGLTLSGSVEVCSGLNFSVDIVGTGFLGLVPTLNSLTATASMGAYSDLTLEGNFLNGSFDSGPITLATLDFPPIDVPGLPVWVTPEVGVFVGAHGNLTAGITTEVSAAGSYTGGVTYASGAWSPVPLTPSFQFAYQPPTLNAGLSAKAYAGIEFDLYVYDIVGPSFKPDGYLDLEASLVPNPSWTLTGGLEGPMSLDVTFLGETLASYDLGTMFNYSDVIASGTFSTEGGNPVPSITSLSPSSLTVGAAPQNLIINGTGFLSNSAVTFNGIAHAPTFVSSTQLTISLTASDLATASTFPVVVTNPAPGGGASNVVNFIVGNPLPVITSLSPSSVSAGSAAQAITINGTGFVTSSSVSFNGASCTSKFVSSSQLSIGLTTSDVATAGTFPVSVANPAPGGGVSNAIYFTVSSAGAGSVTLSPTSVTVPQGGVQTFAASVADSSDGVTWSIQEGSAGGTLVSTTPAYAIYQPPTSTGTFHIVATNADNPAETSVATVTIGPPLALTVLHTFQPAQGEGSDPVGSLIQASDGNFYGTTHGGGTSNSGTVFKLDSSGQLTVLYSFSGTGGASPDAGLIQATDANFYGTTFYGGTSGRGTAFKMDASGNVTILDSFSEPGPANPYAGLIQAADGSFYGTTYYGGTSDAGTAFRMDGSGIVTLLHSFSSSDGTPPYAGLIQASDGNFYGTTYYGGVSAGLGDGTIYKMDATGTVTVVHSFSGSDGAQPFAGLVQASDGHLYGTTLYGGASGYGTAYRLDAAGGLTALHSFSGSDGSAPYAALIQGSDGNLYGTCSGGGSSGQGTIFRMDLAGNVTVLHSFSNSDAGSVMTGVIQGTDGNLYGTGQGGSAGSGVVFRLDLPPAPQQ